MIWYLMLMLADIAKDAFATQFVINRVYLPKVFIDLASKNTFAPKAIESVMEPA